MKKFFIAGILLVLVVGLGFSQDITKKQEPSAKDVIVKAQLVKAELDSFIASRNKFGYAEAKKLTSLISVYTDAKNIYLKSGASAKELYSQNLDLLMLVETLRLGIDEYISKNNNLNYKDTNGFLSLILNNYTKGDPIIEVQDEKDMFTRIFLGILAGIVLGVLAGAMVSDWLENTGCCLVALAAFLATFIGFVYIF